MHIRSAFVSLPGRCGAIAFAFLLAASASAQNSEPQTARRTTGDVEVVVEGFGSTPEEALHNAFRAAVRQVVGTLTSSETLIKDDRVVYRKVLTMSEGYIERYRTLSQGREGSLFHEEIAAVVKRGVLSRRLRLEDSVSAPLDGQQLHHDFYAQTITQRDFDSAASDRLAMLLQRFPLQVARVRPVGSVRTVGRSGSDALLAQDLSIAVDRERYEAARSDLIHLLEAVAKERGEFVALTKKVAPQYQAEGTSLFGREFIGEMGTGSLTGVQCGAFWKVAATRITKRPFPSWTPSGLPSNELLVAIKLEVTSTPDLVAWRWYRIDRPNVELGRPLQITLTFQDENKGVVLRETFPLGDRTPGFSIDRSTAGTAGAQSVMIAPELIYHRATGYLAQLIASTPSISFTRRVRLSSHDLMRLKTVECAIGPADDSANLINATDSIAQR